MFMSKRTGMWADVDVGGAVGDFIKVFRETGPNRWRFAVLAAIPPVAIFTVFMHEEAHGKPPRPEIIYISSWRADRSLAEIERTNIENQRLKDRIAALEAKRAEDEQRMYMALGRASGFDVDAMKKQADADRAAQEAKVREAYAELRKRQEDYYGTGDKH